MTQSPHESSDEQPSQSSGHGPDGQPVDWVDADDPDVELGKVLSDLEQNREMPVQRGELVQVLRTIQVQHSGPLPPPALLEQYDGVIPNGADRIMGMAEREQAHRHEMERRDQNLTERAEENSFRITQRGQFFGLAICVLVLIAGVILALTGHPTVAVVLVGIDLVALAAVFVVGRYLPRRSRSGEETDVPDDESDELSTIEPAE